jgi:hypothetical protein
MGNQQHRSAFLSYQRLHAIDDLASGLAIERWWFATGGLVVKNANGAGLEYVTTASDCGSLSEFLFILATAARFGPAALTSREDARPDS